MVRYSVDLLIPSIGSGMPPERVKEIIERAFDKQGYVAEAAVR
jgi:hypothetical protein